MPFSDNQELDLGIAIDEDDNAEEAGDSLSLTAPPRKSMRRAINEHCKTCTYDDEFKGGGTWKQQVEACQITKCALWEFRPVSRPRKVKTEE